MKKVDIDNPPLRGGVLSNFGKERMKRNYLKDILKTISIGQIQTQPGQVTHVEVLHDDDCPFLQGGECTCKPEVRTYPSRRN